MVESARLICFPSTPPTWMESWRSWKVVKELEIKFNLFLNWASLGQCHKIKVCYSQLNVSCSASLAQYPLLQLLLQYWEGFSLGVQIWWHPNPDMAITNLRLKNLSPQTSGWRHSGSDQYFFNSLFQNMSFNPVSSHFVWRLFRSSQTE